MQRPIELRFVIGNAVFSAGKYRLCDLTGRSVESIRGALDNDDLPRE